MQRIGPLMVMVKAPLGTQDAAPHCWHTGKYWYYHTRIRGTYYLAFPLQWHHSGKIPKNLVVGDLLLICYPCLALNTV